MRSPFTDVQHVTIVVKEVFYVVQGQDAFTGSFGKEHSAVLFTSTEKSV